MTTGCVLEQEKQRQSARDMAPQVLMHQVSMSAKIWRFSKGALHAQEELVQASRSEGRRQTAHGKAQRVITPEARRERMRAHRRRKKARYSSSADEDELEDLPDTDDDDF